MNLADGTKLTTVVQALRVSGALHHRSSQHYGGLRAEDVKSLKQPKYENKRLMGIVAEKEIDTVG